MTKLEKAAKSFFVLAEANRLMTLAHDQQLNWNYEIKANTMNGPDGKPELDERGLPRMTGGYEIHIVIQPPEKS